MAEMADGILMKRRDGTQISIFVPSYSELLEATWTRTTQKETFRSNTTILIVREITFKLIVKTEK